MKAKYWLEHPVIKKKLDRIGRLCLTCNSLFGLHYRFPLLHSYAFDLYEPLRIFKKMPRTWYHWYPRYKLVVSCGFGRGGIFAEGMVWVLDDIIEGLEDVIAQKQDEIQVDKEYVDSLVGL